MQEELGYYYILWVYQECQYELFDLFLDSPKKGIAHFITLISANIYGFLFQFVFIESRSMLP